MKIIYTKSILNTYKDKNNIFINKLTTKTFLEILRNIDKDIYTHYKIIFKENKYFKIGFSALLDKLENTLEANTNILKTIIELCEYSEEVVNHLGEYIYNNDYDIIKDCYLLKDSFKMLLIGNNVDKVTPLVLFEDYPNVNILFLVDSKRNAVKVVCRKGFELYNKKIFFNIRENKHEVYIKDIDSDVIIKKFRELKLEDIADENNYELDKLSKIKNFLLNEKDIKFFNEVKEAFIQSFKEFFLLADNDKKLDLLKEFDLRIKPEKKEDIKEKEKNSFLEK